MKKIEVRKWKETMPNGKEETATSVTLISNIINRVWQSIPNGIENFRSYKRIANAMEAADKGGDLLLEEADYSTLKNLIEKNIPAAFGMNTEAAEAIEEFLKA